MTSATWAMADALGLVPQPPNPALAAMLAGWWSRPRLIGCSGAKEPTAPWFVVAPQPEVICGTCAVGAFREESRCSYCHRPVQDDDQVELWFEMTGGVTVLGRAHLSCHEGETTCN